VHERSDGPSDYLERDRPRRGRLGTNCSLAHDIDYHDHDDASARAALLGVEAAIERWTWS